MKHLVFFLLVASSCSFAKKEAAHFIKDQEQDFFISLLQKINKESQRLGKDFKLEKMFSETEMKKIDSIFKSAIALIEDKKIDLSLQTQLTPSQLADVEKIIADTNQYWFDKNGFMRLHSNINDPSNSVDNENPFLFTSEYYYVLYRLSLLTGNFKIESRESVRNKFLNNQLQPGLYDRVPAKNHNTTQIIRTYSHDEQAGSIAMDAVFSRELGYIEQGNDFGKKYFYVYNNRAWSGPDKFNKTVYALDGKVTPKVVADAEAFRLPEFTEYVKRADQSRSTLLSDAVLCGGLLLGAKKPCTETSGKMLTYLQILVMKDSSKAMNSCFQEFLQIMKTQYSKGMSCNGTQFTCDDPFCNVASIYFQDPEHPIRKLGAYLK